MPEPPQEYWSGDAQPCRLAQGIPDWRGKVPQTGFGVPESFDSGKPVATAKQGMGWGFQLLPYIEETSAHNIQATEDLQKVVVQIYTCPSRRQAKTIFSPVNGIIATMDYAGAVPCTDKEYARRHNLYPPYDPRVAYPLDTAAKLSQVQTSFCGGSGTCTANEPRDGTVYDGVIVRSTWRYVSGGGNSPWVGVAARRVSQPVSFAKISDGTSKTLLVAEKYIRNDNYDGGAQFNSDDRGWCDGWDADQMRSTCIPPTADSDPIGWQDPASMGRYYGDDFVDGAVGGSWNVINFGSAHTTGINSAFADGSVHTISFDIDPIIFNSLGTRNGYALEETDRMEGVN